MKNKIPAMTLGLAILSSTGCVVGPDYSRPTTPGQTSWKESPAATNQAVLPREWWRIFDDPQLDALESQAISANQDLKIAAARVAEARALARVSASELYPTIGAGAGYTRSRLSENRQNGPEHHLESDDFVHSFDLSYELDIWGRVRRSMEAANAEAAAIGTDLEVVLLTLTADVARHYHLLRSLDNERVVIEATINLRRDAVQLQGTRNQAGLDNQVDLTRARTELANVEAELHAINRARAQLEHALAVLCGQPTGVFSIAQRATHWGVPHVPAGLPSTLLERRPDIVEAEQFLQSASAQIGVAKAAFFPTIKLTGAAGLASADLGTLINWPSRIFSIGPSIHVPIFEGGRNRANLAAAEARFEQTLGRYRGTILNAFREVEDALSDLSTLAAQSEAVSRALRSARDTVSLATERYQRGLTSYLEVVDAERLALQAERQEVQLRGQRAVSTILLAKALGGGWNREATE